MKFFLFLFILFCSTYQKKDFETITGKITKSKVEKEFPNKADYLGREDYKIIFEYEYIINEQKYSSNKISFSDHKRFNSKKKAEKYIQNYKEGDSVKIFYLKEKPEIAILDPNEIDEDE